MTIRRVAVLGGGNGAHAHAADLALAGHDVRMAELPAFAQSIAGPLETGGIEIVKERRGVPSTSIASGGRIGFGRLSKVTTNIGDAVKGAELIIVPVPAYGQRAFMEAMIPFLEDGQIVLFCPGKFACLEFRGLLEKSGSKADIIMAEGESLIYSARLEASGRVWIKSFKKRLTFATIPSRRVHEAVALVHEFYPQFVPVDSVLQTSFYNPGIVCHPVSTLLNVVKIEQMGAYPYSYYDVTPSMARVMEAVDRERMEVARSVGIPALSYGQVLHEFYGSDPSSIYNALTTTPSFKVQAAPDSVKHRYITEDVPYGLVPIAALGHLAGVSTRHMDAIIDIANAANGADYRAEGRTLARLGLEGKTAEDIRNLRM